MKNLFTFLILFAALSMRAQTVIRMDEAIEVQSFTLSDVFNEGMQKLSIEVPASATERNMPTWEIIKGNELAANFFTNSLLIYNRQGVLLNEIKNSNPLSAWKILQPYQEKGEIYEVAFSKDNSLVNVVDCQTEKTTKKVSVPKQYAKNISTFVDCGDGIYGAYTNNVTGVDSTFFVFFNAAGEVIKTIKENRTYVNHTADCQQTDSYFYTYNGNLFFQEQAIGNTVYEIKNQSLVPHIVFDFGDKFYKYEYREMPDGNKGRYTLGAVCETQSRIYFSITLDDKTQWGYYDKQDKKTYLTLFDSGVEPDESNFMVGIQQACPKAVVIIGREGNKYRLLIGELK